MGAWKKKRRIKERYNLTSRTYDEQYLEEQNNKYKHALSQLKLKSTNKILDVGCGSGLLFSFLPSKVRMIVGIDISNKLLLKAKKEENRHSIHLIQADADNLPIKGNIFDVVFSFTLLQNMPNPKTTIEEMKIVTKNDGKIILTALKKAFSIKDFCNIIKKSGLNTIAIESIGYLKDHMTINEKKLK